MYGRVPLLHACIVHLDSFPYLNVMLNLHFFLYQAAFRPSILPQTYNYGSVKKAREFYIFDFAVEEDKFKYRLLYRASNDSYSLGIDFTYDPSVPLKVEVPAFDMDEMVSMYPAS